MVGAPPAQAVSERSVLDVHSPRGIVVVGHLREQILASQDLALMHLLWFAQDHPF